METKNKTAGETAKKTQTIGKAADNLAKTYKKLYDDLAKDKNIKIRANAERLALNDLYVKKIIARMAIDQVEEHIKKRMEEKFFEKDPNRDEIQAEMEVARR